jgi:hypothetical protein
MIQLGLAQYWRFLKVLKVPSRASRIVVHPIQVQRSPVMFLDSHSSSTSSCRSGQVVSLHSKTGALNGAFHIVKQGSGTNPFSGSSANLKSRRFWRKRRLFVFYWKLLVKAAVMVELGRWLVLMMWKRLRRCCCCCTAVNTTMVTDTSIDPEGTLCFFQWLPMRKVPSILLAWWSCSPWNKIEHLRCSVKTDWLLLTAHPHHTPKPKTWSASWQRGLRYQSAYA